MFKEARNIIISAVVIGTMALGINAIAENKPVQSTDQLTTAKYALIPEKMYNCINKTQKSDLTVYQLEPGKTLPSCKAKKECTKADQQPTNCPPSDNNDSSKVNSKCQSAGVVLVPIEQFKAMKKEMKENMPENCKEKMKQCMKKRQCIVSEVTAADASQPNVIKLTSGDKTIYVVPVEKNKTKCN